MTELIDFDLETTGPGDPDPDVDRIVEFSFEVGTGTAADLWTELVHPGSDFVPIPERRTEIHGIGTEDLAGRPGFSHYAEAIQNIVEGATLCGYGIRGYDIPILDRELRRVGQPGLEKHDSGIIVHPEVDLLELWKKHERRDLTTADRRFGRGELGEEAHRAGADTAVLPDIRTGMLREFAPELLELAPGDGDSEEFCRRLVEVARPPGAMDRAGCFRKREEDDVVVFAFSKHRGDPVRKHPGMLEWMLGKDFPQETKQVARHLLARVRRGSS